jgi:tetratricopeptide (TPR) repeat protein
MPRTKLSLALVEQSTALHFGLFLKMLRHRHRLQQLQVLAHLPNWTQASYSRVESGLIAPAFDQLVPLYTALRDAGVELTAQDRQQFLTLARLRIEKKKSYLEHKTDQEWDELRLILSRLDRAAQPPAVRHEDLTHRPDLIDIRHLIGRADWLASIILCLQEAFPKKLLVLQGPGGIGKTPELFRIARHFLTAVPPRPHVIVCPFPYVEDHPEPENALDQLLSSLMAELGPPDAAMQAATLAVRTTFTLRCLEKTGRRVLVFVDNAEHLLEPNGQLVSCWKTFLERFLRCQHQAMLILATREWPGWRYGEQAFVVERLIPPLTVDESIEMLQKLGLASVPSRYLQQASEAIGGVPLCLEWVASLVQKPLLLDRWDDLDDLDEQENEGGEVLTRRLRRLLDDPALFGGPVANRLTPLLARILDGRLSTEAMEVLNVLALARIPLGQAALQHVCPRPSLLKELRALSLLTTHQQRVQVLPMVAAAIRSRLKSEQQHEIETRLIEALQRWLDNGTMSNREMGAVIAELATLYIKRHRLLDAADLLIAYGWMSFNNGYGPPLARLFEEIMKSDDWRSSPDTECGTLLLRYILPPFLGKTFERKQRSEDFQRVLALGDEGKVTLPATTKKELVRVPMVYHMNRRQFEEAISTLEDGIKRLEPYQQTDIDIQTSLPAFRAMVLAKWSDYLEEQGAMKAASSLREETIALFRQCCITIGSSHEALPLKSHLLKKRLSAYLNYLGYRLIRNGQAAEALEFLNQSIALGEQGYCNFGALAAAYGDMSQALMELGRFEEALLFDEKAMEEVQRCAESGDTFSQNELWIYRVNRGRLYLRLGRIDEAELLLKEAEPHIQPDRYVYRLFARRAIDEIERQRGRASSQQEA